MSLGYDRAELLSVYFGDVALIEDIIGVFLANWVEQLNGVRAAVEAQDADALQASAHKLKGSVQNFRAHAAEEAAKALEQAGRDGALEESHAQFVALDRELAVLAAGLQAFSSK